MGKCLVLDVENDRRQPIGDRSKELGEDSIEDWRRRTVVPYSRSAEAVQTSKFLPVAMSRWLREGGWMACTTGATPALLRCVYWSMGPT